MKAAALQLKAAMAASAGRFQLALFNPERAQAERLMAVLNAVRKSWQGRHRGLARVRTAKELQQAVPLTTSAELQSDVEAIGRGEQKILTSRPVLRLEPSGGSSGPRKWVPITNGLLAEFQRAIVPWLFDLLSNYPGVASGPCYWSISPMGKRQDRTSGGLAVGSADDAGYFPQALRTLIARLFAVPPAVAQLPDVESCRYVTLRFLLASDDLAFVSIWNPSFLTLMMDALDKHVPQLVADLAKGTCRPPALTYLSLQENRDRSKQIQQVMATADLPQLPRRAEEIGQLVHQGRPDYARVWNRLALISMWTDAQARRAVDAVRRRFPSVQIQGKGLLATEGVITIPLAKAPAPVLAVRSHFYEFLDASGVHLAHELEQGRTYEVVLSTSGGLLRYRLGDLVRVEGFLERAPCFKFLGRADRVCDLVGEKLSEMQVSVALDIALRSSATRPRFSLLAPEWTSPPAYHLYLEWDEPTSILEKAADAVERELLGGYSYRYARELGQLGPVQACRVENAARQYEARCVSLGQRAGDVKPLDLHRESGWMAWFQNEEAGTQPQRAFG